MFSNTGNHIENIHQYTNNLELGTGKTFLISETIDEKLAMPRLHTGDVETLVLVCYGEFTALEQKLHIRYIVVCFSCHTRDCQTSLERPEI